MNLQVAESTEHGQVDKLGPGQLVCVSAISKMVASTATYPHEVMRSYMHIQVRRHVPLLPHRARMTAYCRLFPAYQW